VGSFSLVDHGEGSGGFIAIPGSHKANFPTPPSLIDGSGHQDLTGVVVQPNTKAGDVILFSEGTVHG
jgi:ectoine hydroxylase-related dioxygenase (phytanoyl-CoA dioxygenase family)